MNYSLLDFHYRTGNEVKVQTILKNTENNHQNAVWFDDVGYLIYIIKNWFHPKKCKLKEVLSSKWEFSLFSLYDWSPFASCIWKNLQSKNKAALNILIRNGT